MTKIRKERFNGLMGAEPIPPPIIKRPSVVRIRANGAAGLQTEQVLSSEIQQAWLGGVVFGQAPVRFDEERNRFIVNEKAYTSDEVYAAVSSGSRLD